MNENLGFGSAPANPYLNPVVDTAQGDMVRNFNMSVTPSIRSAMVQSGSFGNSGLEQMAGEAERQLQTSLGRQANDMRYGDFWSNQQFGRQLFQDAQQNNLNNLGMGMGLLGTMNQFNQQDMGNATNVQNTPLNYWQTFSNGANAMGQGYGNSTSSMSMPGSPMMGALGGWQLGGAMGKAFGTPGVTDGGYSVGQGSAYSGTTDVSGMFTPFRRGM